jgi:hypothetical protein
LYEGISYFKKGYQLRTNKVKDEKGGLFADTYSVMDRWRKHSSQLLIAHNVNVVRQK